MGSLQDLWPTEVVSQMTVLFENNTSKHRGVPAASCYDGSANGMHSTLDNFVAANPASSPYAAATGAAAATKMLAEEMYGYTIPHFTASNTKEDKHGFYAATDRFLGLDGTGADIFGLSAADSVDLQTAAIAFPTDVVDEFVCDNLFCDTGGNVEEEEEGEKRTAGNKKVAAAAAAVVATAGISKVSKRPAKVKVKTKASSKLGYKSSDKIGSLCLATKQRGVGNPSDFGGLADEEICESDFETLLARMSKMNEPLKNKIKERRKQLKNRVHAKRAAAKREKRASKNKVENDGLQAKVDQLRSGNVQLVASAGELRQQAHAIGSRLREHRTEMNELQAKLTGMSAKLQQLQQSNAGNDADHAASVWADRGGRGGAANVPQAETDNGGVRRRHRSSSSSMVASEVAHRRAHRRAPRSSGRGGVGSNARPIGTQFRRTEQQEFSNSALNPNPNSACEVALVPDALTSPPSPPSPDVEVSLDQLELSSAAPNSKKHRIDAVYPSAAAKRVRLCPHVA